MIEHFRLLVIHQARFYRAVLDSWGNAPEDRVDLVLEALGYDAMWLTKFPLLWTPTFDLVALDSLTKNWAVLPRREDAVRATASAIDGFRRSVDADQLRFVLKLTPGDLETRVELFFGGRAMNKPLWQYLAAWQEHAATLRGRVAPSGLLDTVLS